MSALPDGRELPCSPMVVPAADAHAASPTSGKWLKRAT